MTAARLRTALTGIADAWDDTLEPARRDVESHALTSMVNPPLPISAGILDTRRTAHIRLAGWSRAVIAGRKLHLLAAMDVPALCAFLLIHVDYMATATWNARCVADLESSASDLGVIAAQNAPHRFQVGHCPGSTTAGARCPGMVKATVRADDDLLPSQLTCNATPPHSWPAGEWRVLNRRMHAQAGLARRLTASRETPMDEGAAQRLLAAISAR